MGSPNSHADIIEFSTSCCNLKIRGVEKKLCVAFPLFLFERNHDVLKSKSPCFLLNKNVKYNKDKEELKIENHTHSFREINHVSQLV